MAEIEQTEYVLPKEPQTEVKVLEQGALKLVDQAKALSAGIRDQGSYELAAGFFVNIGRQIKAVQAFFLDPKTKAYATWKAICEKEGLLVKPMQEAEVSLRLAMGLYETEQARIRAAEAERIRSEQQKKLDDAKIAVAAQLEKNGNKEEAAAVRGTPVMAAPVTIEAPKVEGLKGFRDLWSAEVVSMKELCKAIAEGKAPTTLVVPNSSALNAMAKASKNELQIPGVRVICKQIPVR